MRLGDRIDRYDLARKIACEVDDVRPDIADRAGPRDRLLETPTERAIGIGRPVLQVGAAEVEDVPNLAVLDQPFGQRHGGRAAIIKGHHVDGVGALNGIQHRLRLGARPRQRLLADHVFARLCRGNCDLGVRVIGGADIDNVDVWSRYRCAPVARSVIEAKAIARRRRHLVANVDHHFTHRDGWRGPEEHRHRRVGHGMRLAHKAAADHRNIELFHLMIRS